MTVANTQGTVDGARSPHQRELDLLRQIQAEVHESGRGRAVILHSPGGAGVEALLNEWKRELHREHVHVFEGDCLPGSAVYTPLAEIVSKYVRTIEELGLMSEELGELYVGVGGSIGVPGLRGLDEAAGMPKAEPGSQILFYEDLGRLFTELSQVLAGVVILRDLESADAATRAAVTYLLQNVVTDPVQSFAPDGAHHASFKGTFALSIADESGVADTLQRALGQREGATFLNLRSATEEAVRQFLMRPEVVQRFIDSSGGVADNLQDLLDTIPEKIEDLYIRRCEELSAEEFEVLAGLAVFGKPVGPDLLMRMLANESDPSLLKRLFERRVISRRVHRGRLLVDLPTADNRRLVYARLNPELRTDLHGRMAALLDERMRYGEPTDLPELAGHYLKSNQPEKAAEYAIQAAERLHISFAYEQAIELLDGVLPSLTESSQRIAVLDRLIDLHGCISEHRRALYYCGKMKKELDAAARGPLYRRIGEMLLELGDYQRALRSLETAKTLVEADKSSESPDEAVRIDTVAAEAYYGVGDYDRVVEVCEAGLKMVLSSPSAEAQRQVTKLSNTLGKVHLFKQEYSLAARLFEENQRRAETYCWPDEAARSRFNLGIIALQRRQYDKAEEIFTACLSQERAVKNPIIRAFCLMNLGVVYHKTHRYEQALDGYLHGLATFKKSGNDLQFAVVAMNLGSLYQEIGDATRARALIATSLDVTRAKEIRFYQGWAHYILGGIALDENDFDETERCLEGALEIMESLGHPSWCDRIRVRQAWLAHAQQDFETCAQLLGSIHFDMTTREGKEIEGEARLCLGCMRSDSGEGREANSEFLRALDLFEGIGAKERMWLTNYYIARLAVDDEKLGEAKRRLRAAASTLDELGKRIPAALTDAFKNAPNRKRLFELHDRIVGSTEKTPSQIRKQIPLPRNAEFAAWRARYGRIVGEHPRLLQIFRMIDKVADSDSTVLIQGDSGTGKELIAQALHDNGSRHNKPFIKVNCAAFVETLLLSELFGHEKGAFTGALARKKGRFEMAHGGTIFLDEIGDISPNTQVALLRVLQERTLERVGGSSSIEIDVRIVVATNRNIEEMVRKGDFRLDLYYRLKGIILDLPPLTARREDIPRLLQFFLQKFQPRDRMQTYSIDALSYLARYSWPGNVRELENFTRSMTLFIDETVIELDHVLQFEEFFADGEIIDELPESFFESLEGVGAASAGPAEAEVEPVFSVVDEATAAPAATTPAPPVIHPNDNPHEAIMDWAMTSGVGLPELRKQLEVEYIRRALLETGGNITRAAKILDMKRPRLSQIINATPALAELKERLTA
jgi:transcriptional regulator with GAF, ATPase, and Fis domain